MFRHTLAAIDKKTENRFGVIHSSDDNEELNTKQWNEISILKGEN